MTDKELIQRIRDCGMSIISNAEKIAGNYKYQTEGVVSDINVPVTGEAPSISVNQEFIPENFIRMNCIHE